MFVVYHNSHVITEKGVNQQSLVVNRLTGRIAPAHFARYATQHHTLDDNVYIYPALINAHDHLEFNHYPRTRWREVYDNASQWAADMQPHLEQAPFKSLRQWSLGLRCWVGGFKNLISGVGMVVHHNAPHRVLWRRRFPVSVYRPYTWAHALYTESPKAIQTAHQKRGKFFIHLAEGTDRDAAAEIDHLAEWGALSEKTILIHGVGLQGSGLETALQKSGGMVWCPSSNVFLLGQTVDVSPWVQAEKLLLGSDSMLTADGDLLDELRIAQRYSNLSSRDLFRLVTLDAARLLELPQWGALTLGRWANAFALPRWGDDPFDNLLQATAKDILWVMQKGQIAVRKHAPNLNWYWQDIPYWILPAYQDRVGLEYFNRGHGEVS